MIAGPPSFQRDKPTKAELAKIKTLNESVNRANQIILGYIFGYGAHCFELYGMRTWIVAFWTFVAARQKADVFLGPVAVSVLVTLLSVPASVLGNEASIRFGRHRAITAIMLASAAVALCIGFSAGFSPLILLPLIVRRQMI